MRLSLAAESDDDLAWIKSSYSSNEPDSSCVEVAWRKSSYSSNEGPECVEVAATSGIVLVRDSKNTTGPRLGVAPRTWAAFLAHVSAG